MCPSEISEQNIALPYFFDQRKELSLVMCTNCMTSFVLEHKLVNAPFVLLSRLNIMAYKTTPTTFNTLYTRRLRLKCEELVCEWVSVFANKLRIYLWMGLLRWTFKATSLMVKPFMNGHLQLSKHYGLFSTLYVTDVFMNEYTYSCKYYWIFSTV